MIDVDAENLKSYTMNMDKSFPDAKDFQREVHVKHLYYSHKNVT